MDGRMVKWMNCEPVADVIVCLGSACWYQENEEKNYIDCPPNQRCFSSKFYFLKVYDRSAMGCLLAIIVHVHVCVCVWLAGQLRATPAAWRP